MYDLAVIGGGSGGLACAKRAADLGAHVVVMDYVSPSPQGTKWGLGGTCVNVGCIPKKLFHQASLLRLAMEDAKAFGWKNLPDKFEHDWETLAQGVQDHIGSLNWGHRVVLSEKKIEYVNGDAVFIDESTVRAKTKREKIIDIKAKHFVVAVGGRPRYPDIPGAREHCITSDDLFWRFKPPGKTLVIGASLNRRTTDVALEIAGFLRGLGYDTTVMMRSIPLRGFDQQMAELICDHMALEGTVFLRGCVPVSVTKSENGGHLTVVYRNKSGVEETGVYDTVLMAIGRDPVTPHLKLSEIGVELDKSNKVIGDHGGDRERSSKPHIYAIGDILNGGIELTPVAVQAGKLLADRLFSSSIEQMDYVNVATTVFTPREYGAIGLSEEAALAKLGEDQIEIYHTFFKPLEFTVPHRPIEQCYMKVICERADDQKVIGFHYLGPNAGEVTQGFAAAVKCGLTYKQLRETVGIHPTCAEDVCKLTITKRSGIDVGAPGC